MPPLHSLVAGKAVLARHRAKPPRRSASLFAVLAWTLLTGGCSLRSIALNTLADTFASAGNGYSTDSDPDLVKGAVPFALKTMEQVAAEKPHHVGLRGALASGFTQYAYAFVMQDADELEDKNIAESALLRVRARKLFLRGRDHGLAGLDAAHPGFAAAFSSLDPSLAVRRDQLLAACVKADVPLLYWTAASWMLAVANGKDQMRLIGDLPFIEKVMARALALDESFEEGAIHEFYVSYDGARSASEGGGPDKARAELERARGLSKNKKVGALVSFAEGVDVTSQNKPEFKRLLEEVLAFDVDQDPAHRLANLVAQRRARWLLARTDDLFAE